MIYNFDQLIDRLPYSSSKWNMNSRAYQRGDLLPLWVADGDITSPEPVKAALRAYADHGVFGYAGKPAQLDAAVKDWLQRKHQWTIDESWLTYPGGVVASLYAGVRACTAPGDAVVINDPVYPPFAGAVRGQGREVVWNPLVFDGKRYLMDFDHLRKVFAENKPKMMIFCSPHNAAGRVWTWEELQTLKEILLENDCYLLSDEIHFDLVWDDHHHYTAGLLGEEIMSKLIMTSAASKTFNVAGLHASYAVIPNEDLRKRFQREFMGGTQSSFVGQLALKACYTECDDYLEQMKAYITKNLDFFVPAINERCAPLKTVRPEGTYLVWVDCRGLGLEQKEMLRWLMEDIKIRVNDGTSFGPAGDGFVRFNMAAPRVLIEEAVERLETGIAKLK